MDSDRWEVDQSSLSTEDGTIRGWTRITSSKSHSVPGSKKSYLSRKDYFAAECSPKRLTTTASIYYDEHGHLVDSWNMQKIMNLDPVSPDSMGDAIVNFACHKYFSIQEEKKASEAWKHDIAAFKQYAKLNEGIDYDASPELLDAWDMEVKRLAKDPANAEKSGAWFLSEAHKNVKARFNLK